MSPSQKKQHPEELDPFYLKLKDSLTMLQEAAEELVDKSIAPLRDKIFDTIIIPISKKMVEVADNDAATASVVPHIKNVNPTHAQGVEATQKQNHRKIAQEFCSKMKDLLKEVNQWLEENPSITEQANHARANYVRGDLARGDAHADKAEIMYSIREQIARCVVQVITAKDYIESLLLNAQEPNE